MQELEQILDSREVSNMVEKDHAMLLRDLRRYTKQFTECKIAVSDFFRESEYKDSTGRTLPCYQITKKGCEFIAHKLTGTKGTIFTARYINRFHEMEGIILQQEQKKPELPWFIHKFKGRYIMLFRDFEDITGVSLHAGKPFWKAHAEVMNSRPDFYYNGYDWHTTVNREEFKKKHGFDYGDDDCLFFLYLPGIRIALDLCRKDRSVKIDQSAYDMIMGGLKAIREQDKKITIKKQNKEDKAINAAKDLPVTINIIYGNKTPVPSDVIS